MQINFIPYSWAPQNFVFWRKTDEITKDRPSGEILIFLRNLTKFPILNCKSVAFYYLAVNQAQSVQIFITAAENI